MNKSTQEDLLGYLLGALDAEEHQQIEKKIERDEALQSQLNALHAQVTPLDHDSQETQVPAGLARRTCESIAFLDDAKKPESSVKEPAITAAQSTAAQSRAAQSRAAQSTANDATNSNATNSNATNSNATNSAEVKLRPARDFSSNRSWSVADLCVASAICMVMGALLFPMISQSRQYAQQLVCQENLRQIGMGIHAYADTWWNSYPALQPETKLGTAGATAPILNESGVIADRSVLFCPMTIINQGGQNVEIPTLQQLRNAEGLVLKRYYETMGGGFAYSLGVNKNDQYVPQHILHRPNLVMVGDAPVEYLGQFSSMNHGMAGQNLCYEDGSVRLVSNEVLQQSSDDPFRNRTNQIQAGTDINDSVVGPSEASPLARKIWVPESN